MLTYTTPSSFSNSSSNSLPCLSHSASPREGRLRCSLLPQPPAHQPTRGYARQRIGGREEGGGKEKGGHEKQGENAARDRTSESLDSPPQRSAQGDNVEACKNRKEMNFNTKRRGVTGAVRQRTLTYQDKEAIADKYLMDKYGVRWEDLPDTNSLWDTMMYADPNRRTLIYTLCEERVKGLVTNPREYVRPEWKGGRI